MLLQSYLTNGNEIIDLDSFIEGITFKQDINPDNDLSLGNVGAASIEFKVLDGSAFDDKDVAWAWYFDGELQGYFYPKDKKIGTYDRWTITCYDCVSKLDEIADSWLAGLTYPITLESFTNSLAAACGLTIPALPSHLDYQIYNNFMSKNLPFRSVLEYIGQIANCSFVADRTEKDKLRIIQYNNQTIAGTIDGSVYKTIDCSRESITPINKVQIQSTADDVGYIAGEGDNPYVITGNPLFFTKDKMTEIQQIAYDLLAEWELFPTTYSVKVKGPNINLLPYQVGDRIKANGKEFIVLSKTLSPSGTTLDGEINIDREQAIQDNSAITMLNNKMNELVITVDKTQSTITEITGSMEDIKDEQGNIIGQMATLDTKVSDIEQTANGIKTEVSDIKTTINNLDGEVTTLESKVSTVEQTATELSANITEINNTVDTQNGKITAVEEKTADMQLTVDGFSTKLASVEKVANDASTTADDAMTAVNEKTSEFQQTLDGFSTKLTSVETKADQADSKADQANLSITSINTRVSKLEQDLDGFELRVEKTEENIDSITGEQTLIKEEQASMNLKLDEFSTKLTSVETTANSSSEKISSLEQDLQGFDLRVSDAEKTANSASEKTAELELTVNGFSTRITSAETKADSAVEKSTSLEQTVDGFDARIESAETTAGNADTKATQVKATVDGLTVSTSASVSGNETTTTLSLKSGSTTISSSSWNGTTAAQATTIAADAVNGITLSATNGDSSSTLTLKSGKTTLSSANIQFTGMVSFSDLSTSGKTQINGANITTGKISADRIDVSTLSVEKVMQGTKTVIDCSQSNAIYIGGGSSSGAIGTVYIKANNSVEISKWGSSGGFTFAISTSGGSFHSTFGNLYSLGTATYPWGDIYCANLHIKVSSSMKLETQISVSTLQILPKSSCQLGTSSYQFDAVYTKKLYINGTEVSSSSGSSDALVSGSYKVSLNSNRQLVPLAANTYNLGSSSYYWNEIHAKTMYLYYSTYVKATLACNSSGKLTVNGTVI